MRYKRVEFREPLQEGKVPKDYTIGPDGELYECVPEKTDCTDYFEGREKETETYFLADKDEYWGFVTHCKKCGTEFQAYIGENFEEVRNYCPGCGRRLTDKHD